MKNKTWLIGAFLPITAVLWSTVSRPINAEISMNYKADQKDFLSSIRAEMKRHGWNEEFDQNSGSYFTRRSRILLLPDRVFVLVGPDKPGFVKVSVDVDTYLSSPSDVKYALVDFLDSRWGKGKLVS